MGRTQLSNSKSNIPALI